MLLTGIQQKRADNPGAADLPACPSLQDKSIRSSPAKKTAITSKSDISSVPPLLLKKTEEEVAEKGKEAINKFIDKSEEGFKEVVKNDQVKQEFSSKPEIQEKLKTLEKSSVVLERLKPEEKHQKQKENSDESIHLQELYKEFAQ